MTYQIYIYTLALKDGYYYVGKTIDPDRRFNEHFSDKGAVWTKLHRTWRFPPSYYRDGLCQG